MRGSACEGFVKRFVKIFFEGAPGSKEESDAASPAPDGAVRAAAGAHVRAAEHSQPSPTPPLKSSNSSSSRDASDVSVVSLVRLAPMNAPLLVSLLCSGLATVGGACGRQKETARDGAAEPFACNPDESEQERSTRGSADRNPSMDAPDGQAPTGSPSSRIGSTPSHPSRADEAADAHALTAPVPLLATPPAMLHEAADAGSTAAAAAVCEPSKPATSAGTDPEAPDSECFTTADFVRNDGERTTSSVRFAIAIASSWRDASSEKRFPKLPPLKSRTSLRSSPTSARTSSSRISRSSCRSQRALQ